MSLTAEVLSERIRQAIQASGKTQEAVAKAIEIDPTAMSKGLAGERRWSTLETARLCEVLSISPLALLDDGEPPPDPRAGDLARVLWMADLNAVLTHAGYPPQRDHSYPATLRDRAMEAYLAGHISIRPLAGLIGVDADELLAKMPPPAQSPKGRAAHPCLNGITAP